MSATWDAGRYQQSCGFVWEYGRDLLALLSPQPGERILDVGCGTGQLTAEIAASGADVCGVDRADTMVAQATANYPAIRFQVRDVCELAYEAEFDAIFSNAVLHWVKRAGDAAAAMARALKPGGRLVAEFGARGNVAAIMGAAGRAWRSLGAGPEPELPWFYPSLPEYAALLDRHGFEVTFAATFDRPTALDHGEAGLTRWYEMFGRHWLDALDEAGRPEFCHRASELAAPRLFRDGQWYADYRRLRIVATRCTVSEPPYLTTNVP
jgi:trans-aconitate methyltransferase